MPTEDIVATVQLDSGAEPYLQTIHVGQHEIVADEPPTFGGKDQGVSPYGLLGAALAACTSITLQMHAKEKGWNIGPVRVQLVILRDGEHKERILRTVVLAPSVTQEQRNALAEKAKTTPVTVTLLRGTEITTTFR